VSIGAGKAARILGVSPTDIQRVTRTSQVTLAQVQAWQAQPPEWLTAGRERKRRRDDGRKRRAAARRKRRADDRRLCPPAVAQLLGLRYGQVAAAMRAAAVCEPLSKPLVQDWLAGASCARGMPAWLSELLAAAAAQDAGREAQVRAAELEVEHRRLLVEERVREKLLAGKRRFRGADLEVVEEWAFEAAKELVRNDGEVDELEAAVLEAVGVDAGIHATWPLHVGSCDGLAGDGCDARIAELAAQRFEEQEATRHERRERSRRDADLIASEAFRVGQPVLAYYDRRAGVVTKINQATVKVKHVGGQSDHYGLVNRNYSPAYLHPLPENAVTTVAMLQPGKVVTFLDWGRRLRSGEVVEVDGPLLRVVYRLASGKARTAWIDALHLDDVGGRP
jgi:hypothetical protein